MFELIILTFSTIPSSPFCMMSLMIQAARLDTETEAAKMRISSGDVGAAILVTQVNVQHVEVANTRCVFENIKLKQSSYTEMK